MPEIASLFAAFTFGLFGSLHCVAMCGPLAVASSSVPHARRSRLAIIDEGHEHEARHWTKRLRQAGPWTYQLARALGYALFGAVFGGAGMALGQSLGVTVSKLLPYALVTTLVLSALDLGRWLRVRTPFAKLRLDALPGGVGLAFVLGALTPLIPCGFLYATVPLAMASGSALGGALTLFAFALGTAPLLLTTSLIGPIAGISRLAPLRRFVLLAAALVIVGRIALVSPGIASANEAPRATCHHH